MEYTHKAIVDCFYSNISKKIGQYEVQVSESCTTLIAFSNIPIATWDHGKDYISITDGGWFSDKALEVLNILLERTGGRIQIIQKYWHLRIGLSTTKMILNNWYKVPLTIK